MIKRYLEELIRLNQDQDFIRGISFEREKIMRENTIKSKAIEEGVVLGKKESTKK